MFLPILFLYSSPDSKKDFLKAVHSILREKQRRQFLKSESMPSNQQYAPFGGKRLYFLKGARHSVNRTGAQFIPTVCMHLMNQNFCRWFIIFTDLLPHCLASAPSRTLSRKRVLKNKITVDTELIFQDTDNNSDRASPLSANSHPPLGQPQKPHREDTDRWLEEQFNLGCYEDQCNSIEETVKETDILSDDDEYCKSVRSDSADPEGLKARMEELDLQDENNLNGEAGSKSEASQSLVADRTKHDFGSVDSLSSCGVSVTSSTLSPVRLAPLKHCVVESPTKKDRDVIWVRRDDFTGVCNSDVF